LNIYMAIVLGIDLGTTNSAMAYVVGGKATIIENAEGARTTPSVFYYNKKDSSVTIGEVAKRNSVLHPEDTFYEVKRFIGHRFEDEVVKNDKAMISYGMKSDDGKVRLVTTDDKMYAPEQISAAILRKLKNDAEAKLGQSVNEAVITVPAYFDDAQRQATKDAGEIAGLKVLRIINEPTAAALAYGFEKGKDEKVLVYDLGGGTFDVTTLEISQETIEVLSTNGNTHLGGKDLDSALIRFITAEFKKDTGIDLSKDKGATQRIKEAAEKAKHDLSTQTEHQINLPFITMDSDNQPQHLLMTITRAKFEDLVGDLIKDTLEPVKKALADANLDKSQIDEIIMVGGMTRMPLVQKTVEEFFGKKPNLTVNPDEVVAMGAAIQGAVLKGDVKDILLLDVTPLTLAIETSGNIATAMIPRNTTIPTSKTQVFSTAADNQQAVDVHVVQGERPMSSDNKSLGKFTLSGIPAAPRGVPQIEVVFDLDANGILTVTATDKGTSKKANITITDSSTLSEEEKEAAIKEAEAQKDADLKKKSLVEAKNNAQDAQFQISKMLRENKEKIGDDLKAKLEEAEKNLGEISSKDEVTREELEKATTDAQKLLMSAGEEIYSKVADEEKAKEEKTQPEETIVNDDEDAQDVDSKPKDK
jgi:molecular chaperone DnaK